MVEEIAVDRDVGVLDVERAGLQPFRVGVAGGLAGLAFAKEQDVGDDTVPSRYSSGVRRDFSSSPRDCQPASL